LRKAFIEYLLRSRGLFYMGPDETLEASLKEHHPYVLKQADELVAVVNAQLKHDAVFQPLDPSGKTGA
jgi:hypothetical protein